jgi:hypothetical protein
VGCNSSQKIRPRLAEPQDTVPLPHQRRFFVAGAIWAVSTNAQEILDVMQEFFEAPSEEPSIPYLTVSFYVDFGAPDRPRWSQPHFRALDHLYYATYGPGDSLLIDQNSRRAIGLFSLATARDSVYWKRVILPVLAGIASACLGVSPLHCACLVKDELGLLLSGESGAGKSTLALSLSLNGFTYLSDDCTYISRSGPQVRGWGLPTPVKLLPDAVRYFSELRSLTPATSLNGELSFEVDPVETFGVTRSLSCEPRWVVFVERTEEPGAVFERISSREAASRFASDLERLPPCISHQREYQLATIEALVKQECWLLRHGMSPLSVAQELVEFCKT